MLDLLCVSTLLRVPCSGLLQMLAMQEQWGAAFKAAGDIGRLRHQPGPVGVAMLSTGFTYINVRSLLLRASLQCAGTPHTGAKSCACCTSMAIALLLACWLESAKTP